jgi:hypothetical protein
MSTRSSLEPLPASARPLHQVRRRLLGALTFGTGALLSGVRLQAAGERLKHRGRLQLGTLPSVPRGLEEAVRFPLVEALLGRRARRFSVGSELPDGPLAYTSTQPPLPLDELEQMLVLTATTGNTGWHHLITRHERYAPHLSNYSAAAGGRTFPSSAGFHTVEFFYTDDQGVYFLPTRDSGSLVTPAADGSLELSSWLAAHKSRIRKLSDGRLHLPAKKPFMEGHNTWCVNRPGSTLVIPVADIAQHLLLILCFLVQNGYCIFNDVHGEKIPGMEKFRGLVDVDNPFPLTFIEQYALTEATAELSTACYAGMLMLQALGLGGWMFDGIDRFSLLGASGKAEVPGLGFHYQTRPDWVLPHITGRPGVFESYTPPHFPNMRAAVDALVQRKFSTGGPFHPRTPGPWKESSRVRSSAQMHSEEFKDCVATMAQYLFDRWGRFPATVPAVFSLMYLQAHHLDLGFYDEKFQPGSYLETHARHMEWWHGSAT